MSKQVKPSYYDSFVCSADKCSFTCCQQWKIAVDDATRARWKQFAPPPIVDARKPDLSCYTIKKDGSYVIQLKPDGSCPFLQTNKLCSLVVCYGEACLSHTCHTFPRERHLFKHREELTLAMGCPEALRLLWTQQDFQLQQEDAASQKSSKNKLLTAEELLFSLRDTFLAIAAKKHRPIAQSLKMIFYLALELCNPKTKKLPTQTLIQSYTGDAALDELDQAIQGIPVDSMEQLLEHNELFLDITANYQAEGIYLTSLEPVIRLAEQISTQADTDPNFQTSWNKLLQDFNIYWNKQLEVRMRLLFCEELYSTCLTEAADKHSMLLKLQWMAITYACLRHWLLLLWSVHHEITEEQLIETATVLIRMTGYQDDDIEEYLTDSFASLYWEWGYFALLV